MDIDEDFAFQKASWRYQLAGEILIILFVLAGLAGVFGAGGIATKTEQFGGTEVEYPRFVRAHTPAEIKIKLSPAAAGSDAVLVSFDAAFFERFEVEDISPRPRVETLGRDAVIYEFAQAGPAGVPITARVKATKIGSGTATITVGAEAPMALKTFVFP